LKEELRKLVELIKERTGKTQEDIAIDMGYKKNYISEILSPKGKVTDKFMAAIKLRFSEDINIGKAEVKESLPVVNEDPAVYNKELPLGDLKVTLKDYVELLKEKSRLAEESKREAESRERTLLTLLESNLAEIKANSIAIKDQLVRVDHIIRSDDAEIMEGTDKILGREVGTTAIKAGIVELALGASDADIDTNPSRGKKGSSDKERRQRKA
jgi:transcriptional regulator with XRE-family HTH domain